MKIKTVLRSMALITAVLAAAAVIHAGGLTSYAYYTKSQAIPNVRVKISTGELEAGDDLSGDAESYVSVSDTNKYYELDDADWLDDVYELKVGDEPRMQIYLYAIPREVEHTNYSTIYLFSGSYNSSNVTVTGGTLVSADIRDSGYCLLLTVRLDAIKGTYDDPTSAYWGSAFGTAIWTTDNNDSGYYDVYLYRGSQTVKKLTDYRGNSYNFYPYMTKEGEYSFKVRTVPDPSSGTGKQSGWTESTSLSVSGSQVSDGSGQSLDDSGGVETAAGPVTSISGVDISGQYGFISVNGLTYFRYPDGSLATGWLNLSGTYYRFNDGGVMQTGWFQNIYGEWFYLDPSMGAMQTGWLYNNGSYYYLRTETGDYEGSMVMGLFPVGGKYYYFGSSGAMQTGWIGIDGKYYYFYPAGSTGGEYGYMATNTVIDGFTVGDDGAWLH